MPETYKGEERRQVDPNRNKLPLGQHAARALNRFTGQGAEKIDDPNVKFTEGDTMRMEVKRWLTKLEPRELSSEQKEKLLATLETRFNQYPEEHQGAEWNRVKSSIEAKPEILWSIQKMEETGGEPDVVVMPGDSEGFCVMDCSKGSPSGRRNTVYDKKAEDEACAGNAADTAEAWGIELTDEEQWRYVQKLLWDRFGDKLSYSWDWLKTDPETRKTGLALNGGRHGSSVDVFRRPVSNHGRHWGWRGSLRVKWA